MEAKRMNQSLLTLDAATARRLAVEASCDPKTIIKALRNEPVRGMAGYRAREVLEKHGLLPPEERPFRAQTDRYGGEP
jgi:hypothetical protein